MKLIVTIQTTAIVRVLFPNKALKSLTSFAGTAYRRPLA